MGKADFEIKVMMFGGRRAGKTSVLAAMEACFEEQFGTTNLMITPAEQKTMLTIEEKQREIEAYFGKNRRNFTADGEPTLDVHEYTFNVRLKSRNNSTMAIKFIDYPGEWLENKIDTLKDYMEKSNIIIIAIDTPCLMEEAPTNDEKAIGQYNDYRNYCKRINHMLRDIELNSCQRMILFVPLKCEKYKNSLGLVAQKIEEAYKPVLNIFEGEHACNAEIAILPILTIGNVEFVKFKRDDKGDILIDKDGSPLGEIFIIPNIDVAKPMPLYCEQPMVYILCYLLEMATNLKKKKLKGMNEISKWFYTNIWEKLWNMPSINDYMEEKELIRSKMKTGDDGFVLIKNPLKF